MFDTYNITNNFNNGNGNKIVSGRTEREQKKNSKFRIIKTLIKILFMKKGFLEIPDFLDS